MNIYAKQMKNLGLNENQYSKLTGIPVDILKKLLKNEKVSENMGLNDFFRKSTVKVHNELEEKNVETQAKAIEIKMNDVEKKVDLLDWYENEYDKNVLMEKYNCVKETQLLRKIPIVSSARYSRGRFFEGDDVISVSSFNRLINKRNIGGEYLEVLLPQLYDYYTNENIETPEFEKKNNDSYTEWWNNFNLKEWLVENEIPIATFTREAKIGHVSYYNIVNTTHQPTLATIKKIKDYVDKKEKGEKINENIDDEILKWYEKEFEKDKLLKITNCKSIGEFYENYKIITNKIRASRWFYFNIISKNTRNVRLEIISEFATQLKDILEGNKNKYRDYFFKKGVKPKDELEKWWLEFDFKKFLEENDISNSEVVEELKMPKSTFYALKAKRKDLGNKWVEKIKEYVESFGKKEIEMKEIEIIDDVTENEEPIEIIDEIKCTAPMFDSNAYVRELVKNSLTEKEKWLITLFGGHIEEL